MNLALAEQIANAVLYEGHILYPYRPSAVKNRQRWTFGAIFPQASRLVREGSEAGSMRTECLVEGSGGTMLDVRVRFLHLQDRLVGALDPPLADLSEAGEPAFRPVAALHVGGKLIQAWQESVEREVLLPGLRLDALSAGPQRQTFTFPAGRQVEAVHDPGDQVTGVIIRQQVALAGTVEVAAEKAAPGLFKVTVQIHNRTPVDDEAAPTRNEAVLQAFVSTHTLRYTFVPRSR